MSLETHGQSHPQCIKQPLPGSPPSLFIKAGNCWGLDKAVLNQLLKLLENKENGLSLSEISRSLQAQPSAVIAMLNLLVQKGKLLEIGPDGGHCATCGAVSDCNLLAARGKRYLINS